MSRPRLLDLFCGAGDCPTTCYWSHFDHAGEHPCSCYCGKFQFAASEGYIDRKEARA